MTNPLVSVIVVSYNRAEDLRLCLSGIFRTGYPSLEVIVVDNASIDTALHTAGSFSGVTLIRNEGNAGFAEGNNQGLALAHGKYIALINNDAVVAPDYFCEMVAFLESRPDCAAAGGKAYFWDGTHPVGDRRNPYYSYTLVDANTGRNPAFTDTPDNVQEVATLSGCAVVVRRQAINEIRGGFLDPYFFTYYEETDFFARAIRQGWKLYYVGEPAVWHRVRTGSAGWSYDYHFYMERNRILYAWRNFDQPELDALKQGLSKKVRREYLQEPIRHLLTTSVKRRAHRDARRWYRTHRPFLEAQRRSLAGFSRSYNQTVREIQAREMYHRHGRPEVLALLPPQVRYVIDIGCGAGYLGAAIKKARPQVQVRGIEIVPEQAQAAGRVLDEAVAARAEDPLPTHWPQPDCVIFADVLEHLQDPWEVLRYWAAQLSPGGWVVASLPNVAHVSVLRSLAGGKWEYEKAGILDRTHLRFFTWASVAQLMESCGLEVVDRKRILEVPADLPGRRLISRWVRRAVQNETPAGYSGWRRFLLDACTVQVLVVGNRKDDRS